MSTYTVWTSYADPKSLQPVGTDAVCTLYDNIICFHDIKSHEITYYKAEGAALGLSISVYAGHNRIPIVAFAEVILRPSVHIIQYPKLNKYTTFNASNDIIAIVDLRFNEFDLLCAISGFPNYTFIIWNFRSGHLMLQQDTHKESIHNSLILSAAYTPQIVQYSARYRKLMTWEICDAEKGQMIHRTARIELEKEFKHCNTHSMCFSEDENLYIVDDFGAVSQVQTAQTFLLPVWSPEEARDAVSFAVAKKHYLYPHRQGLLVNSLQYMYYIRSKDHIWDAEWKLLNVPHGGIYRLISNGSHDIYGSMARGNIYQVEPHGETATLKEIYSFNTNAIDVVLLNSIKDECLIQLTKSGTVKTCDLSKRKVYSELKVPNATAIVANNASSYIAVGTSGGSLHFFDFSDVSKPKEVEHTQNESGFAIASLQYRDSTVVYRDVFYNFVMVHADVQQHSFYEVAPVVTIPEDLQVIYYALPDENTLFIFVGKEVAGQLPHATHLWSFTYNSQKHQYTRREYELPYAYRNFTQMKLTSAEEVEFVGARENSTVLDVYHLTRSSAFVISSSVRTKHLTYISGLEGSRNVLSWSVDAAVVQYRWHKKSSKPFAIGQVIQMKYRPRVVGKILDCFNLKYLVFFYAESGIKIFKISIGGTTLQENHFLSLDNQITTGKPNRTQIVKILNPTEEIIVHTPAELQARDNLLEKIHQFATSVSDLIDYDIGITGKTRGVYRKFCLNKTWLDKLTAEGEKLCKVEAASIEAATTDQARVRDWLRNIIMSGSMAITYKIRAIFSNFSFENYGKRKPQNDFNALHDYYALYDLENDEEEEEEAVISAAEDEFQHTEEGAGDEAVHEKPKKLEKPRKLFNIKGGSVFKHLHANELALQDVDNVTANQMWNFDAKVRLALTDRLREEFNHKFDEIRKIKFDLMDAILGTNTNLNKIYDNMNIMLRLLRMDTFIPPELSVPMWQKDEFIERIMEVDDSEIKAINRRKKKAEAVAKKQGRWLLWALEFWVRALIVMMDGVLEKLWEEEIKKDIPIPEFMKKKDPAAFNLEEQRIARDYEEKVNILTEDRKKFLRILGQRDLRTNETKMKYITKLNEHVTQMMISKLKYDFCIKHIRLRNLTVKIMHYYRTQGLKNIQCYRRDIVKIGEYNTRYTQLAESWGMSLDHLRAKHDNLIARDRAVERQFKNHYLTTINQALITDMLKAFKRRPKLPPKLVHSILMCRELSVRINARHGAKYNFPLPKEAYDYLDAMAAMDSPSLMPASMEPRQWDVFTRARRQKIEMELRIKANNLHIADTMTAIIYFNKEADSLKKARSDTHQLMYEAEGQYMKALYDQTLECRLTMGQVELNFLGSLSRLENCILMHEDDINDINALILKVGLMKLKGMQRVARFRRQVIFREWEHKVMRANIEYLKFMLQVIEKCKVTMEFLNIIRNWEKVKANKEKMLNYVGLIERTIEEKQISYRRQLERLAYQIAAVRQQIDEMKQAQKQVNRKIVDLQVDVAFCTTNRDFMIEDKRHREQDEIIEKILKHSHLMESIRRDYARIMELRTIWELLRLRTYPNLGTTPDTCSTKITYMPNKLL